MAADLKIKGFSQLRQFLTKTKLKNSIPVTAELITKGRFSSPVGEETPFVKHHSEPLLN